MKEKKLETLLKGGFRPLESKEGNLWGGVSLLDNKRNGDCGCPPKNHVCRTNGNCDDCPPLKQKPILV